MFALINLKRNFASVEENFNFGVSNFTSIFVPYYYSRLIIKSSDFVLLTGNARVVSNTMKWWAEYDKVVPNLRNCCNNNVERIFLYAVQH